MLLFNTQEVLDTFLTIHDFSKYFFVYFFSHNSQTFRHFRKFKIFAEKQMGKRINQIRTDLGDEFCSKELKIFLKRKV